MNRRNLLKVLSGLLALPLVAVAANKPQQHPPVVVPPRIIKQPAPPRRTPDRPVAQMIEELRHGIRNYVLQFNDEITRHDVAFNVNRYCENVGVYEWHVICDTTNNPPSIVDSNQLVVDLKMKPKWNDPVINFNFVLGTSGMVNTVISVDNVDITSFGGGGGRA